MLKLALFFLVVALIAGLLGFTKIAAGAAGIAKTLFYIALAIFVIVLAAGLFMGSLIL